VPSLPPSGPVTTATEETGQAEQVPEVVPGTVVVNLVDIKVASEERDHKHKRRDEAVPHP